MRNTIKYTLLSLIKEKNVVIWVIAFPLILATLFNIMFSGLDDAFLFKPIPVAVVDDAQYRNNVGFAQMVETLSAQGEEQVFDLHYVGASNEAEQLLVDGTVMGYFQVNEKAAPELFVTTPDSLVGFDTINQTILKGILDNFLRTLATIETIAKENPMALADPSLLESLYERTRYTEEISIIANNASSSVRFFYALLGFAAIMASTVGMFAVARIQANLSALGARRALGATSRVKTMSATLLASWLLSFACLLIAFCYIRYVLGINFGRDMASIFGLGVASLMATALGACVGAIPKLGEGVKGGILTGLTCFFALFAGLYGEPSQKLADDMVRSAPYFQKINPAKQVTDLFYSLYFYDGYSQFFQVVLTLLVITFVLFFCTALLVRRQRYASL